MVQAIAHFRALQGQEALEMARKAEAKSLQARGAGR